MSTPILKEKKKKKKSKRKREQQLTTSISTVSIAQPVIKKKRVHSQTTSSINYKPNYLKTSDTVLKNALVNSLDGVTNVSTLFDTPEKIQYIREYAQLLNNLFYLRLKQDFWENYYKIAMISGIWSIKMSKQMIKDNSLPMVQFMKEEVLQKYRQQVIEDIKQATDKLTNQPIMIDDMQRLNTLIPAFVRRGQHRLKNDFERKKLLLQLNAQDYRFVQAFYDLKPSNDQINSTRIIWKATQEKLSHEEHLAVAKQRIYTKRLPTSFDKMDQSLDSTKTMIYHSTLDNNKRETLLAQGLKLNARHKHDLMTYHIQSIEEIINYQNDLITNEKKKLIDIQQQQEGEISHHLPKPLIAILNAISMRQSNMSKRIQVIIKHKLSFFVHILPSSPIIEAASKLSSQELLFLANGPKYIPLCQSRFSRLHIDTIIEREYQQIRSQFARFLTDNCMSVTDSKAIEFFNTFKHLLQQLYSKSLPSKLVHRAQYDHTMVKSIRRKLRQQHIVIQRTDKSKVLHLATRESYQQKAMKYMKRTNAYREISTGINPCSEHIHQVLSFIDPLLKNKKKTIDLNIWKHWMRPNPTTTQLAYLYFIPKPHKIGTPLRPIVSSMKAAATGISHYLDRLLRPLFDDIARQTTFVNSIHFVRRLELYEKLGRLSSSTQFITFDVTDLYTMIPRDNALLILKEFLHKYAINGRIHDTTIDTLMKMAHLVLDTNCFTFENKLYQQIRGGAMGSPFTMTLANIYMLKWEQSLIEHQKQHNELYGRYIDDVFMTSNLSTDEIHILLNRMNRQDENIQISWTIGTEIDFLDVSIAVNKFGKLKTSVFHKPAAEVYIVPFLSDHSRRIHRNIIKGALLRALRLCSTMEDFNSERLNIEMTLLLNGYPPKFISYHFRHFFEENKFDLHDYKEFHEKLISRPTRREQSINLHSNRKDLYLSYRFENGPLLDLTKELHRIWKKYYLYKGSPMLNTNLKIHTRNNKSLHQLLTISSRKIS